MTDTKPIPVETPVGELQWVFIDGKGKKGLNGEQQYVADVFMPPEKVKTFIAMVDKFWVENKPKGAKKAKSLGYRDHQVKDEEASKEAGEIVYVPTGNIVITAKTGIAYQSGDQKIIKIFNGKGNEISLQGKKIGNGSRGLLGVVMAIYDFNAASQGVTFYLNYIQLSKFIEFTGSGVASGGIEDEEGEDFDHIEGQVGQIVEDEDSEQPEKPRL